MLDRVDINILESEKFFLWLPPKTGSNHASWVFSMFKFEMITCSYDRKQIYRRNGHLNNSHPQDIFEGHENYKLICTARHPLERIFSAYIYQIKSYHINKIKNLEVSKKSFIKFFIETYYSNDGVWLQGMNFQKRTPDYFLRLEHLYEDYMKIPFVAESELVKSGKLSEMCTEKKNSAGSEKYDIKDFYTQDMIDSVYKRFKDYFNLLGYEPKL